MRRLLRRPNEELRITCLDELSAAIGQRRELIEYVIRDPARHYERFEIAKKNGSTRVINPPSGILKSLQRSLLDFLYRRFRVPPHVHGGVPKRSIFTNAKSHVGKEMLATFDVRDFFPSTTVEHLLPAFATAGFSGRAVDAVVNLTMLDERLVQGSPTSCYLANLGFNDADRRIIKLCSKRALLMTRYVDDIAITGNCDFRSLRGPICEHIEASGFTVANEKTKFTPRSQKQVVTGLQVNDRLRPTTEYRAALKRVIRLCIDEGVEIAAAAEGMSIASLKASLTNKVHFLRQSDPKMASRFRGRLCGVNWHP